MNFFRTLFRAFKAAFLLSYGVAEVIITRPRTRPERAAWLSRTCSRMLRGMDVQITTVGTVPMEGAVITNHLTFFDILTHSAIRPCVFVSKAELRKTPVLGWMSMMAGTVYVERGAGGSATKAAEGMAKAFRDHLPLQFFPEGTTGTGDETVMPFRSGLIANTIEVGAPITPGFIQYHLSPQDVATGRTAREDINWGEQSLLQLLWRFCELHSLRVSVRFAEEPVHFSEAAIVDRKIAAEEARQAVLRISSTVVE